MKQTISLDTPDLGNGGMWPNPTSVARVKAGDEFDFTFTTERAGAYFRLQPDTTQGRVALSLDGNVAYDNGWGHGGLTTASKFPALTPGSHVANVKILEIADYDLDGEPDTSTGLKVGFVDGRKIPVKR